MNFPQNEYVTTCRQKLTAEYAEALEMVRAGRVVPLNDQLRWSLVRIVNHPLVFKLRTQGKGNMSAVGKLGWCEWPAMRGSIINCSGESFKITFNNFLNPHYI